MPKVLVIAPYFPPRQRVGALRPFRFITRLAERGWESKVICFATPGATLHPETKARLDGIERWEIPPLFDRTRGRAASDLEARAQAAPVQNNPRMSERPHRVTIGTRVARWVDARFPVDTWLLHMALAAPGLVRRARGFRPDLVWTTADPWSALGLGRHLARRLQVPFMADLRDP